MTEHQPPQPAEAPADDPVESIVSVIPLVLPLAGGIMMFLLAFIAVTMA